MCGFTVFMANDAIEDRHLRALRGCNAEMPYRGPDESGLWSDEHVGFAHVRLSIIGVDNGRQPLTSGDGRITLVCNGEIYNHHALRRELEAKGHVFSTRSDSEVIIYAYLEYGADCIDRLDGMFAFCLYDRDRQILLAARDHAGKKPLYYAVTDAGVVFSSEHKAIRRHFLPDATLNYEVIRQVQRHRYPVSDSETYVSEIRKIPDGGFAIIEPGKGLQVGRWYERSVEETFGGTYEQAVERTRELLFRAVEKRLESEVPLAILLSAGIDSSAICCIAAELGCKLEALTASYDGGSFVDESAEVERLVRDRGFAWRQVTVSESDFRDSLPRILDILDEPNGDPSMFAQWGLYNRANEAGYTVLLSGVGGDEIFYGYRAKNVDDSSGFTLKGTKLEKLMSVVSFVATHPVADSAEFVGSLLRRAGRRGSLFNRPEMDEVLEKAAASGVPPLNFEDLLKVERAHEIDKVYYAMGRVFLPNNCYFLADKLAMAHSIEVRAPLADRDLVRFIDTLPLAHKFPRSKPKGLMKDALRGIVPDYVLDRQKTGFTPPPDFIDNIIRSYRPRFFSARPQSLAQVTTDHFAAEASAPTSTAAPRVAAAIA